MSADPTITQLRDAVVFLLHQELDAGPGDGDVANSIRGHVMTLTAHSALAEQPKVEQCTSTLATRHCVRPVGHNGDHRTNDGTTWFERDPLTGARTNAPETTNDRPDGAPEPDANSPDANSTNGYVCTLCGAPAYYDGECYRHVSPKPPWSDASWYCEKYGYPINVRHAPEPAAPSPAAASVTARATQAEKDRDEAVACAIDRLTQLRTFEASREADIARAVDWMRDDPERDGTDAAHPAWWRGHDRAEAKLKEQIDAARAEVERLKAAIGDALSEYARMIDHHPFCQCTHCSHQRAVRAALASKGAP